MYIYTYSKMSFQEGFTPFTRQEYNDLIDEYAKGTRMTPRQVDIIRNLEGTDRKQLERTRTGESYSY